jgi:hypothetical protein
MGEMEYNHLLGKCRDAHRAKTNDGMSTSEKLAVAIVLNRLEWLAKMDYSLAEAFDRVGPTWWPLLLRAQRQIEADNSD